ncbi:unnamed protein product [Lactuca virosa]|uniref:Uncharacterized protein n=1 Tax=Lactuca virosa TaxID=75947 RepID=A0AAU9MAF5_9ASTR|nr:unnamed protein product [Lactuca virosa]
MTKLSASLTCFTALTKAKPKIISLLLLVANRKRRLKKGLRVSLLQLVLGFLLFLLPFLFQVRTPASGSSQLIVVDFIKQCRL